MPRPTTTYDIFIASPSDVNDARQVAVEVIHDWNATHSWATKLMLQPVRWETHSYPEFGDRPQALINRQIVDIADILIGIFWTRLGTDTGKAPSGTAEEIARFRAAGKPVLLYFSKQPVVLESVDIDEYKRLKEYQISLRDDGLYTTFEGNEQLRELLTRHLALVVHVRVPNSTALQQVIPVPPNPARQRVALARGLRDEVLRIQAEWNAEQAAERPNADSGRFLLSRLASTLARIAGSDLIEHETLRTHMQSLLTWTKNIERTVFYMDGGVSWYKFWGDGTEVMRESEEVLQHIAHNPDETPTVIRSVEESP